jgi:hypothetical protein
MLGSLRRLFGKPAPERDLTDIAEWAQRRGFGFKRARGDEGFVVDGLLDGKPWRVEWGPSQRDYIPGHELRFRMELALGSDAQMLLLSRPLLDALESQTFDEFTDNVQTQIGTKSPEEMRWLVMFPKVNLATLKDIRHQYGAVANDPVAGLAWLEGPLANMLGRASQSFLADSPPFVLMTLRSRAYLRMQLDRPDANTVGAALGLFEVAVTQAMRSLPDGGAPPSTGLGKDAPTNGPN